MKLKTFLKHRKNKGRKMINILLIVSMIISLFAGLPPRALAAPSYDSENGHWDKKTTTILNETDESQLMIRVGDIDNFGLGWESSGSDFNPFSGNDTEVHKFPWDTPSDEPKGLDKIMVVSGYDYNGSNKSTGINRDGYTEKTNRGNNEVQPITLSYDVNKYNCYVKNAVLQMFVDDIQPGNAHGISKGNVQYKVTINNIDIPELSNMINSLDQSGPRGRLITFQIPDRYIYLVETGILSIKIDDTRDGITGDGYAVDFVKLLINFKKFSNTATITGHVNGGGYSLAGAKVTAGGIVTTTTDNNGYYKLEGVPAGQAIITASKNGYKSQTKAMNVVTGGGYVLNFNLDEIPRLGTPVLRPDTMEFSTQVIVNINYPGNPNVKEYRINGGLWKVYSEPIKIIENCFVEARGKIISNDYESQSDIGSLTINNIKAIPPGIDVTRDTSVTKLPSNKEFNVDYTIIPAPIIKQQTDTIKDIVLVMDTSPSMEWIPSADKKPDRDEESRLDIMKKVANGFVDKFAGNNKINISMIQFNKTASKVFDFKDMKSGNIQEIHDDINALRTYSNTNTGDGLRKAYYLLNNKPNDHKKFIVLMTDGFANTCSVNSRWDSSYYMNDGDSPNIYYYDNDDTYGSAQKYAVEVASKKIKISDIKPFIIGFGSGADETKNKAIANAAGGYYNQATDEQSLSSIYNQIQQEIEKSIYGNLHFEESISNNLELISGDNISSDGKKIYGDVRNVQYTPGSDNYYHAEPIKFTVTYKTKDNMPGPYTLGKGGKTSFAKIQVQGQEGLKYFEELNIDAKDKISTSQIGIAVKDASGIVLNSYNIEANNPNKIVNNFLDNEIKLKGDSFANFTFKSEKTNGIQYQFINSSQNPQNGDMPTTGWNDINVDKQTFNDDVVIEKRGLLNQRSYDVSHMPLLSGVEEWSNPDLVFKTPFVATDYKAATYSKIPEDYGKWEDYSNGGIKSKRWVTNSIFMENMSVAQGSTDNGDYKEASKFWGYIKVPRDGTYTFGCYSDDGCKGYITANGITSDFVNMFRPQSMIWGTTNNTYNLKANEYYPIYLEYFNWGGSAALQMYYSCDGSRLSRVPQDCFYPSKDISPGEYEKTIFTGNQGVKFPKDPGKWYVAFRTVEKNDKGNVIDVERQGFYGPFTVEAKLNLTLNRELNPSGLIGTGNTFEIKYKIQLENIKLKDLYPNIGKGDNPERVYTITANNFKYQDELPIGLTCINENNDPKVVINGQRVEKSLDINKIVYDLVIPNGGDITEAYYKPTGSVNPIRFVVKVKAGDESKSYKLEGEKSILTYVDIDGAKMQDNFNDMDVKVGDSTIIWKHGILDKNSPNEKYIKEIPDNNYRVTDKVPILMAMFVEVKSLKPQIDLKIDGAYSAVNNNINFKIYEYKNGVVNFEGDEPIKLPLPTNALNIRHENMGTNDDIPKKYIISYELKPDKSKGDIITIDCNVNGQVTKKTLRLNIVNLPNLQ